MNLLSNLGKQGVNLGLNTLRPDIEDTEYLSKYFVVSEFYPVFTAGKNFVSFNGSDYLDPKKEILVECLDSTGQSQYIELAKSTDFRYVDTAAFVLSIHVYAETYNGPGKLILVGTTKKGEIVRWRRDITLDKTLVSTAKVRFRTKPTLEVRPLQYPVLSNIIASTLTTTVNFSGPYYGFAVTPPKDTKRSNINVKVNPIDYRVAAVETNPDYFGPSIYPTTSFNTQMEGHTVNLRITSVYPPYSYTPEDVEYTASYTIKKVLNSSTIQLNDAHYYTDDVGNSVISNIADGEFSITYPYITYNTASEEYQQTRLSDGKYITIKRSYAEVNYRNLKTFTGMVSRHKLYRKSLVYPGDYQLVADDPLLAQNLLVDQITLNKSFNDIGTFYNQNHIDRYWFTSSNAINLQHSVKPKINAMEISPAGTYDDLDGTEHMMVRMDVGTSSYSTGNIYVPYDEDAYNDLSGSSYSANFMSFKKDVLYVLSTNAILKKSEGETDASLRFFITSSAADLYKEKTYNSSYGYEIGNISTDEITEIKYFNNKHYLYFTPTVDFYGTLVIVPEKCGAILSELSVGVYGDYAFSPDILTVRVPFELNVANETFEIKAELFDINSNLIYSDLRTIQTFDPDGETLYTYIPGFSDFDPTDTVKITGSLVISQSLFMPNIAACPSLDTNIVRLMGIKPFDPLVVGDDDTYGHVCYTDIVNLTNDSDYISLTTYKGGFTTSQSVAVVWNGRHRSVDNEGNRTETIN